LLTVAPTSTARSSSTAVLKSAPICAVSPPSFAVASSHGVICARASASKSAIDAALSSAPPLLLLLLLLPPVEPPERSGQSNKKKKKKTQVEREKNLFFFSVSRSRSARFSLVFSLKQRRPSETESETVRTDFALDSFEALDDELEPLDQLVQHGVGHGVAGFLFALLSFLFWYGRKDSVGLTLETSHLFWFTKISSCSLRLTIHCVLHCMLHKLHVAHAGTNKEEIVKL
jgi:hypothetical protein